MATEEKRLSNEIQNAPQHGMDAPQYRKDELINASGHVQELERNFSLVSLAGIGISVGNVWPAAGGSILVALYNGGPPGSPLHNYSSPSMITVNRGTLRIYNCLNLLLDCCTFHRRACQCHSIIRRRLSLGIRHARKEMGSLYWVPSWMVELPCLGVWGSLNVVNSRKHHRSNVRAESSGLRREKLACLHRVHHCHVASLSIRLFLQSCNAAAKPIRHLLHRRRLLHHHRRARCHARTKRSSTPCNKLFRLG